MVYNPTTLEGQMTIGSVPGDTILHCGTSGPADDQRLTALDRSQILLPDRNGGWLGLIWPRNRNGSRACSTAGRPTTTESG